MNDAIKEVRVTLEQARTLMARHDNYNTAHHLRPGLTAATAIKLTDALDVLTGEVERLDEMFRRMNLTPGGVIATK